ncbi:MAG: type VII toxin-antitoxin system MntA family adenylyltransferase antitoxin [Stellaceae bacterium]
MTPVRECAIEKLQRIVLAALGEHDAAVWLFGSWARGEARQHSDIDIAILPRDDLPVGFFGGLQADLEESSIPYDVDLVDLRHADPALIDEIQRDGVKWRD